MGTDVKAQISTDMVTQINSGICANLRGKNLRKSAFKKAQASIEVTLAFICFMILLFGSVKIFIWLNINKLIKISGMKNFLSSKNSILNISNVIITLISFILIVFTVYFTVDFLQKISSQVNDKK